MKDVLSHLVTDLIPVYVFPRSYYVESARFLLISLIEKFEMDLMC